MSDGSADQQTKTFEGYPPYEINFTGQITPDENSISISQVQSAEYSIYIAENPQLVGKMKPTEVCEMIGLLGASIIMAQALNINEIPRDSITGELNQGDSRNSFAANYLNTAFLRFSLMLETLRCPYRVNIIPYDKPINSSKRRLILSTTDSGWRKQVDINLLRISFSLYDSEGKPVDPSQTFNIITRTFPITWAYMLSNNP